MAGIPYVMNGTAHGPAAKRPKLQSSPGQLLAGSFDDGGGSDDEGKMKGGNKLSSKAKRFQHCEVEKRRRERMNRYMAELAQMIPACNAVPRRLDKLSILKMAVDHMKNLRGDPHSSSDYKPGFLSDNELKKLVVEAANGFMLIIDCSQARVLFVSDTIQDVLQEQPDDWLGVCLYDLLHPKDIQKVKEQLACFDMEEAVKASVRHNTAGSPLVMHTSSMNGLRRSFLCRVKKSCHDGSPLDPSHPDLQNKDYSRSEDVLKLFQSTQQNGPYRYAVLHCTGFIRNLTSTERHSLKVEDVSGACLVMVARLQHFGDNGPRLSMEVSENEFIARVGADGRFSYVDPRVAGILGYLPQDLHGQVSYEYYHPDDIQKMVQLHHDSMKRRTPMPTVQYRFLSKTQKWVWLAMKAFCFTNPFSQQVEYIVCTNIVMRSQPSASDSAPPPSTSSSSSSSLPPTETSVSAAGDGVRGGVVKRDPMEQYDQQQLLLPAKQNEDPLASFLSDDIPILPPPPSSGPAHNPPPLHSSSSPFPPPPSTSHTITQQQHPQAQAHNVMGPSNSGFVVPRNAGAPLTSIAATTLEDNALAAQRILDEYNKLNPVPIHRRDMNYQFPPGLFSTEVDLEGSKSAYENLLMELSDPRDVAMLFSQIEADPRRPQNVFQDLSLDIFD